MFKTASLQPQLQVAHFFGKHHSHALRTIKNLLLEMAGRYAPNFGLIQKDAVLGNRERAKHLALLTACAH